MVLHRTASCLLLSEEGTKIVIGARSGRRGGRMGRVVGSQIFPLTSTFPSPLIRPRSLPPLLASCISLWSGCGSLEVFLGHCLQTLSPFITRHAIPLASTKDHCVKTISPFITLHYIPLSSTKEPSTTYHGPRRHSTAWMICTPSFVFWGFLT